MNCVCIMKVNYMCIFIISSGHYYCMYSKVYVCACHDCVCVSSVRMFRDHSLILCAHACPRLHNLRHACVSSVPHSLVLTPNWLRAQGRADIATRNSGGGKSPECMSKLSDWQLIFYLWRLYRFLSLVTVLSWAVSSRNPTIGDSDTYLPTPQFMPFLFFVLSKRALYTHTNITRKNLKPCAF